MRWHWLWLGSLLAACGVGTEQLPRSLPEQRASAPAPNAPSPAPTPSPTVAAPPLPDAALLLTAPALLSQLESLGLALPDALGATGVASDTASLDAGSALYRGFRALVALDDSVARWRDPDAGTGFAPAHRLFDLRWLSSRYTRFELVGVVNRSDRAPATPGLCGELRLIYRLAYTTPQVSSRLPMTLNLVFGQPGDCREVARRWLALEQVPADRLADALLRGPLQGRGAPLRLETNFQSGRWPSALRPRLGGHAEYVLRVFTVQDGTLLRGTLENTPTQKLHHGQRAELKQWLAAHTAAIDAGTLLLPQRFLAERTVSAQPRGIARLANRPFSQIAPLPDPARTRRLDQLSCKGCHASRSLAGFHLLGEDPTDTNPLNAIAVGSSPQLLAELPWRRAVLQALADGAAVPDPERGDAWAAGPRPIADRGTGAGLIGEACGTGRDHTFDAWGCVAPLVCKDRHGGPLGSCAPEGPVSPGEGVELGELAQNRDASRDAVRVTQLEACQPIDGAAAEVARSSDGFPAGMCHAPCARFGEASFGAVCGPVPFGKGSQFDGFTRCLSVHDQPFDRCLADDAHPTWLASCDRVTPCRDDYLCVRVPDGAGAGAGACLPPYFLFQVRVDGHRVPEG
jgi:hypothetical protein